jgi:nucleoside-diphosphate-sugar epimerase
MSGNAGRQMVILITGASGLLGARVVPFLLENTSNCRIIATARKGKIGTIDPRVEVVAGDLRDEQVWAALPENISHVVHLASVIPRKPEEKFRASLVTDNLLPIGNLLEHSRRWPNLEQIIYSSSVSVYGQTNDFLVEDSPKRPADLYGASKLAGEELLRSFEARGIAVVSLRLSSLYAYGQYEGTVLPLMINRALQKQPLLLFGDGLRTQDFLHCEDAARAIFLAFQKPASGVYNIGAGVPVTMAELARTVSHVFSGDTAEIVFQHDRTDINSGLKLDISRARRELNYQPLIPLQNGLEEIKQAMKAGNEL